MKKKTIKCIKKSGRWTLNTKKLYKTKFCVPYFVGKRKKNLISEQQRHSNYFLIITKKYIQNIADKMLEVKISTLNHIS